ncbi:2-oxoglutarate and oxygenase superfamily protein [Perilla frutescens var. hirtella]|uniref:2-oxoglutarate and oxygenase superfamily protein n=1 Tax=Perilla frutescens var. hirtella TaxID=608512 RepID=A0AAD4J763_PERFH|nr:2-oxoglutarate and oxygenase superfamily protein [Perilla frutescens var. hirtella]
MKRKMGDRKRRATTSKKANSDWPSVKPKSNLNITRLKDDDLITFQNYLTSAESKAFRDVAESIGFVHQGSLGPTMGEAYRDNDRIAIDDPVLAGEIWGAGLSNFFSDFKIRGKVAVGLNPNIRFYRYSAGQRFGRHIDESNDLGEGRRTYYTLLIYLSGAPGKSKAKSKNDSSSQDSLDQLVGGETVFYGPRNALVAEVAPTEGMALVHIHGDKCMLHEARNVTKGIKYVLRSDVVFA